MERIAGKEGPMSRFLLKSLQVVLGFMVAVVVAEAIVVAQRKVCSLLGLPCYGGPKSACR